MRQAHVVSQKLFDILDIKDDIFTSHRFKQRLKSRIKFNARLDAFKQRFRFQPKNAILVEQFARNWRVYVDDRISEPFDNTSAALNISGEQRDTIDTSSSEDAPHAIKSRLVFF